MQRILPFIRLNKKNNRNSKMKSIRLQLVLLFLLAAFGIEAAVYGVRGEVADSTGTSASIP